MTDGGLGEKSATQADELLLTRAVGARFYPQVWTVEGSRDMAKVARENIRRNGLQDRITVLHALSTDVTRDQVSGGDGDGGKPTVLVSELLGTLLLGEDALTYVANARDRLMAQHVPITVIPARGTQYVTLIESQAVRQVSCVESRICHDTIDMDAFNLLRDTSSTHLTKQLGMRLSTEGYRCMSPRLVLFEIDFATDHVSRRKRPEMRLMFRAMATGILDAAMCSWSVSDGPDTMTTHPEDTRDNLPRDMHWGQAIQMLADEVQGEPPKPFHCTAGEALVLVVRFSLASPTMHMHLERANT
jgi:protein arginine N-methyltransferase 7